MSDNNKPKINVPRFNLTWLYVIIALIFAFLYFSGDEGSATKEVNYTEFQEMVSKGYADKIVAYDNNTVEMYIKPDHIVDVFKKDANKVGRSPSINVQIGSMEALDKFLDEQTKEGNFTGSIQYEKKSDYFSIILWNVLPFVFLIGIWMFAMRRMGGGGGAGGERGPHHYCEWEGDSGGGLLRHRRRRHHHHRRLPGHGGDRHSDLDGPGHQHDLLPGGGPGPL